VGGVGCRDGGGETPVVNVQSHVAHVVLCLNIPFKRNFRAGWYRIRNGIRSRVGTHTSHRSNCYIDISTGLTGLARGATQIRSTTCQHQASNGGQSKFNTASGYCGGVCQRFHQQAANCLCSKVGWVVVKLQNMGSLKPRHLTLPQKLSFLKL
jgi:hypothetical protein